MINLNKKKENKMEKKESEMVLEKMKRYLRR